MGQNVNCYHFPIHVTPWSVCQRSPGLIKSIGDNVGCLYYVGIKRFMNVYDTHCNVNIITIYFTMLCHSMSSNIFC